MNSFFFLAMHHPVFGVLICGRTVFITEHPHVLWAIALPEGNAQSQQFRGK